MTNIQNTLGLQPVPIHHRALSWTGQIAKSLADFRFSLTNNKSLLYQPSVLRLYGIDVGSTFAALLPSIAPYILTPISYGYIAYARIDSPWEKDTTNTLILLSTKPDTLTQFDLQRWQTDYPFLNTPDLAYLDGYQAQIKTLSIDPEPPSNTDSTPSTSTSTYQRGTRHTGTTFSLTSTTIAPLTSQPADTSCNTHKSSQSQTNSYNPAPLRRKTSSHTTSTQQLTKPVTIQANTSKVTQSHKLKHRQAQGSNSRQNSLPSPPLAITSNNIPHPQPPTHTQPYTPPAQTTAITMFTQPTPLPLPHTYSQVTAYNPMAAAASQEARIFRLEQTVNQMSARQESAADATTTMSMQLNQLAAIFLQPQVIQHMQAIAPTQPLILNNNYATTLPQAATPPSNAAPLLNNHSNESDTTN